MLLAVLSAQRSRINPHLWNWDHEAPTPFANARELFHDLALEIPREDEDVVRTRIPQPLWRKDRDVSARKKLSVFMRTPVDGEVQKIGPYAAIVEQRVPLSGRAVTNNPFTGPFRLDQEFQQLALGLAHSRFEILIVAERCHTRLRLPCAKGDESLRDFFGRIVGMARINADRAPMSRKLLDIEERKPVRGKNAFYGVEREIREVLVVDLIELISLDCSQQVRELDGYHTRW